MSELALKQSTESRMGWVEDASSGMAKYVLCCLIRSWPTACTPTVFNTAATCGRSQCYRKAGPKLANLPANFLWICGLHGFGWILAWAVVSSHSLLCLGHFWMF